MGKPWRWWRRARPASAADTHAGTSANVEFVTAWLTALADALADPEPGPPEAAPARVCNGMFTAATISAVLVDRVVDRPEYRAVNSHCIAAAVQFMKVLGEDTLRRYRLAVEGPKNWDRLGPGSDDLAIAEGLADLGEALQMVLCAVTTDPMLAPDVRDTADGCGMRAAGVLVRACRSIRADRPS